MCSPYLVETCSWLRLSTLLPLAFSLFRWPVVNATVSLRMLLALPEQVELCSTWQQMKHLQSSFPAYEKGQSPETKGVENHRKNSSNYLRKRSIVLQLKDLYAAPWSNDQ